MSDLAGAAAWQLVPGDADGVDALARRLGGFARAAAGAAAQLRDVQAGSWVGPAGDAFREQVGDLPRQLDRSAAAFGAAERALSDYADVLREARGTVARAADLYADGERATARWRQAQDEHAAPGRAGADPGADERLAASRLLADARERVDAAGRAAAARLRSAAAHAPKEPSLLSRAMHQVGQFLAGAGEATWGLLELGFKLSPTYALIDPQGFVEHAGGLVQGLVYGVQDPKEFAKAVLDWDTWKENPARALGHLVPDLLLTLATAGAGAAGRGARVLDKAGDLRRARRGLDDVGAAGRSPLTPSSRTPYDAVVEPRVGRDVADIVESDYDPLGGLPDADAFARNYIRVTGDPDRPTDWVWPENNGAVPGSEHLVSPAPGMRIDRIGGTRGEYFTDPGTPFGQRSLPPDRLELPLREWEIAADHPDLGDGAVRLERSVIAPHFGQPGGGMQYRFLDDAGEPLSNQAVWDRRIIMEVPRG